MLTRRIENVGDGTLVDSSRDLRACGSTNGFSLEKQLQPHPHARNCARDRVKCYALKVNVVHTRGRCSEVDSHCSPYIRTYCTVIVSALGKQCTAGSTDDGSLPPYLPMRRKCSAKAGNLYASASKVSERHALPHLWCFYDAGDAGDAGHMYTVLVDKLMQLEGCSRSRKCQGLC